MLSEVAQLRAQIELECEAMKNALYGYAQVANHEAINYRYAQLGAYQEQLETLLEPHAAAAIMLEIYQQVME
ncbi:hypothetical protein EPA93_31165 [Ktedonosporobacter rubrisoli]|uniref:Uncharacterized protein n=1 Tax=Ktedonosporobacter rubrisoli TaxID=2509675 RepID=A0A4P6JXT3_KTERU|nr:hypothetical protein [Ktedonosporobacter rubrisoli]QBD80200.1 hypothetical protein EPA93_31165 [Ktedonosporobacter rubrisoli]